MYTLDIMQGTDARLQIPHNCPCINAQNNDLNKHSTPRDVHKLCHFPYNKLHKARDYFMQPLSILSIDQNVLNTFESRAAEIMRNKLTMLRTGTICNTARLLVCIVHQCAYGYIIIYN